MKRFVIDPWGFFLLKDYKKLIGQYGIEPLTPRMLSKLPEPNRLMRRGIVFAHTDFEKIIDCILEGRDYYALTGIMPTHETIHFGNKSVIENMVYFQEHGARTFVLVADLEAAATRGISLGESRRRALDFHIPAYLALGLDPKKTIFYFQSENQAVKNLAFCFAKRVTISEFKAIYGSVDAGRIMSALLQAGDILFPQLEKAMPGVIPVGVDQSPHLRLCRDVVRRTKRNFGFVLPAGLYHKFTPSLQGEMKMSKSIPGSFIGIPEEPERVRKKLMDALSGGRKSVEEQRRLGGRPERCMIFELYKHHLIESDEELDEIFQECRKGTRLCGECKAYAADLMERFLKDFGRRMERARKLVPKLTFVR
jgi:tryptophanyl-tRNA synthetase